MSDTLFSPQPQDPERERFRALASQVGEELRVQREQEQRANYTASLQTDPRYAARAHTIGRELDLPPEAIPKDLRIAERIRKERQFEWMQLKRNNPVTAKLYEDVGLAQIAHDDLDNLRATEGLATWAKENLWSGYGQTELGVRQLLRAFAEQGGGADSPENQARIKALEEMLQGRGEGFIGGALNVLGQVGTQLPASIGVGLAASALTTPVGGVIAAGSTAFGINSMVEMGSSYGAMRARGLTHEEAFTAAAIAGVSKGAVETVADLVGAKILGGIGGKVLGKGADLVGEVSVRTARASFLKNYLGHVGTEIGTESFQTAIDYWATNSALRNAGLSDDDATVLYH
ncbi:MAG: hypothetical protein VW362_12195, partial [Candidatus Nanopelagicales bacterium]